MDRKISWITGCHDEIELVYEKAGGNERIGLLLSELKEKALSELEECCGWLSINGKLITRKMISDMPIQEKEILIYKLSDVGLIKFIPSLSEPLIVVKFSPFIPKVLGCTMFSVLNKIEKLDGGYNELLFPKAKLEIQLPVGGTRGMLTWEWLIMLLYPWLSVSETIYNVLADGIIESNDTNDLVDEQSTKTKKQKRGSSDGKEEFF